MHSMWFLVINIFSLDIPQHEYFMRLVGFDRKIKFFTVFECNFHSKENIVFDFIIWLILS